MASHSPDVRGDLDGWLLPARIPCGSCALARHWTSAARRRSSSRRRGPG